MKNNRGLNLTGILKADMSSLLWNWLKGIWGSFNRFVRRSLYPNQGRRASSSANYSDLAHICPLVGISQFRHAESLTVSDLMAKVKWRIPIQTVKVATSATAPSASVASVKDEINWD
jgi:hypothetical protein